VKNIPVYSHCEHHLAPFFGTVTIGYVPNGKIVGLSKLTRLVDCFAHRLQVQERLTSQIANALMDQLQAKAVGVVVKCRHLCMESRGIRTQGEETVTSSMLGELQPNQAMRTEFLALARES
jgi:GTP cyclohydrolase IA